MFELDNSGRLMKLLFSYHAFVSLLCLRSTLRLLPYTRIDILLRISTRKLVKKRSKF